jgi:Integrase core domain
VFGSLLYLMVGCVMALVLLCFRSSDFKELEIVVLRHELASVAQAGIAPGVAAHRSRFLGRGEPAAPQGAVALVLRHAGNVAGVAPPARRSPVDVSGAASRPPQGHPGCPRAGVAARSGEPSVGIPADRRRASGSRGADLPNERPSNPRLRAVRRECLDWILIANHKHLQHVLREFIDHYNRHRPHRALGLAPPEPRPPAGTLDTRRAAAIRRHDRLGGLLHEYATAA